MLLKALTQSSEVKAVFFKSSDTVFWLLFWRTSNTVDFGWLCVACVCNVWSNTYYVYQGCTQLFSWLDCGVSTCFMTLTRKKTLSIILLTNLRTLCTTYHSLVHLAYVALLLKASSWCINERFQHFSWCMFLTRTLRTVTEIHNIIRTISVAGFPMHFFFVAKIHPTGSKIDI